MPDATSNMLAHSAFRSISQVRHQGDAWLVSASAALLDGYASPALAAALGWDAPPSANVLAAQLKRLGEMHPQVTQRAETCQQHLAM